MDIGNLTDEELNALHREVSDEWIKRNTPTAEDFERMMAENHELLQRMMDQADWWARKLARA